MGCVVVEAAASVTKLNGDVLVLVNGNACVTGVEAEHHLRVALHNPASNVSLTFVTPPQGFEPPTETHEHQRDGL